MQSGGNFKEVQHHQDPKNGDLNQIGSVWFNLEGPRYHTKLF